MKTTTALGVAFAALAMAAYAEGQTRVFVRHGGPALAMDSDHDGWLTRAEAGAAAERLFDEMDANDDGRLTPEDHSAMGEFDIEVTAPEGELAGEDCTTTVAPEGEAESGERSVTVVCHGDGGERRIERRVVVRHGEGLSSEDRARIDREIERAEHEAERAEREAGRAEREAERVEREVERAGAERRIHREVIVINAADAVAPVAPVPPVPPLPHNAPMFVMLLASSEEADINGDGAMSREEFRNQHLRFFDASDVNNDGRVRLDQPGWVSAPEAPEAPRAPEPPTPPRRR